MRCLLLALTVVPTACHMPERIPEMPMGRGTVNPPTVHEMTQEKCLATMIYGEARGEAEQGQVAVAYTAVNRAAKKTVCAVVLAPKQYSVFNDNPALRAAAMSLHVEPKQKNIIDKASWEKAVRVAEKVIRRQVPDPTKGATHYLAPTLMESAGYIYPDWSKEYKMVAVIDNHRFYKQAIKVDKRVASL